MQSTNIIAYRRDGFFGIPIIGETSSFAIKFDTGASKSVISVEKITGTLSNNQMASIKSFIATKNVSPEEFKSASGHPFNAYPAFMKNITIGDQLFEKFYYYLVVEKLHNKRMIALLGDDFIDCCSITKEPHGDIIISKFDFSSYYTESNMISTDEILSLV